MEIFTVANLISFLSLALMEVVLGIDNILFISILTDKLPKEQQARARLIGLSLALIIRVLLLLAISWIIGLSQPIVTVFDFALSWRDVILIAGGLFLIYKSTVEIHAKTEGKAEHTTAVKQIGLNTAIFQIILLDMVFSFDSILTAVGLVDEVMIMIAAVVVSIIVMLLAAKSISNFINRNPTIKMLALAFLLMIGVLLLIDGFHAHVEKGYIYFAIFFSLMVELLNMRSRRRSKTKASS